MTKRLADQHVAPEFTLRDHRDQEVSLAGLLSQGPAVITFYRGYW
jgi:peroxiredoxin